MSDEKYNGMERVGEVFSAPAQADNGAPSADTIAIPLNLLQRISHALHCADVLVDAVPTRLQQYDYSAIAHLGKLVNEEGVYYTISDVKHDLYAFLSAQSVPAAGIDTLAAPTQGGMDANRLARFLKVCLDGAVENGWISEEERAEILAAQSVKVDAGELPKLPKPDAIKKPTGEEHGVLLYTADQMHEYARQAIAAHSGAAGAVPVVWRKTLTDIAEWMSNNARIVQHGPDDFGPATMFDDELGQAAAEIRAMLDGVDTAPTTAALTEQARDAVRWISVLDKLPFLDGERDDTPCQLDGQAVPPTIYSKTVLVLLEGGGVRTDKLVALDGKGKPWFDSFGKRVTHWMPTPTIDAAMSKQSTTPSTGDAE